MTDLRGRLQIYDRAPVPDLWAEVTARAPAAPGSAGSPTARSRLWIALVAAAVMVLIGGAVLVGSGILELPIPPQPVPLPTQDSSSLPQASASPSELASPTPPPQDPTVGTWTATGPMQHDRRENFTVTLLPDGKVLVAGGPVSGLGSSKATEVFDPASMSWSAADDMVAGRIGHAAVVDSERGMVVVTGGEDEITGGTFNSAEFFDLIRMDWSPGPPPMTEARSRHQATLLLDGRILVAGGASDGNPSAEIYDPTVLLWQRTAELLHDEFDTATLLSDGRVLFVGGANPLLFDPETGTWSTTERMIRATAGGHTATRLLDGRVLVAGGGPCCGFTNAAELFDPATDSWSPTGDMVEPRAFFTAALLPDGRVLVAGGGNGGFGGKPSAEVYDPRTGTWTAVADMLSPRGYHEAVALADGRVLLVGGFGTGSPADPDAEVFDPFGDE